MPRRAATCLLALAFLLLPAGCGYGVAGAPTHLPVAAYVIDVPVFKNLTQTYRLDTAMTDAVVRQLQNRTALKVTETEDPGDADAVLRGTVTTFTVNALTYDSTTNQSSSYEITVRARVLLTDRDGRTLYRNDHYLFRQQYESTQDLVSFLQEDPAAIDRLSRDFAENLVADVTESF